GRAMTWARSILYLIAFVIWSAIIFIGFLPVLILPRAAVTWAMRVWAAGLTVLLRVICGVRLEVRGRQFVPAGPAVIAAKHQGMFDTVAPFTFLPDACFVMKKELMIIPFYGWYSAKGR